MGTSTTKGTVQLPVYNIELKERNNIFVTIIQNSAHRNKRIRT